MCPSQDRSWSTRGTGVETTSWGQRPPLHVARPEREKPALELCREGLESCETLPRYVVARRHDACNLLSNGLGEKMLIYAESPEREQGGERKSESSCVKCEQLRSGVE